MLKLGMTKKTFLKKNILSLIVILFTILLSIAFYSSLPDTMASHWNAYGQVDGYSSKIFNVLFFPLLNIFLFLLLILVPRIDPKRKNIEKFKDIYSNFVTFFLLFTLLLQLQVYLWNIGINIPMGIVMPILMGGLFVVVARLVKEAKQNFTIGIRTPWTLDSERVWEKTHVLGYKLFLLSGILSIFSALIPRYSFIVVISSVLLSSLVLVVYSYIEYAKEKK